MAAYDQYTVVDVLNGIQLTLGSTNVDVTNVADGGGDLPQIYGDVANDTLQTPGLLSIPVNQDYQGTIQDSGGNTVGFYTEVLSAGPLLGVNYAYVAPGATIDPDETYTLVPRTDDPATQWDSVNNEPYCFMAGTMIATPAGERAIETLAAGDVVVTASGDTRNVLWIGRQTIITDMVEPVSSHPVVIEAGALGEAVPNRDLHLSPSHALALDGALVEARALVNGGSIHWMQRPPKVFTYYHVELEDHALVLANGAAAETFVDNVEREKFDNYREWVAMFGEGKTITELPMPRAIAYRQVPRHVRALIEARAMILRPASCQAAA